MKRGFRITGKEIAKRWHEDMPRFFYWLIIVACGIGGGAAAINQLVPMTGGVLHEWWIDLYPYIFGTCVGVVFACKFTVAGGYKDVNPDRLTHDNMMPNGDIGHIQLDDEQPPCDDKDMPKDENPEASNA